MNLRGHPVDTPKLGGEIWEIDLTTRKRKCIYCGGMNLVITTHTFAGVRDLHCKSCGSTRRVELDEREARIESMSLTKSNPVSPPYSSTQNPGGSSSIVYEHTPAPSTTSSAPFRYPSSLPAPTTRPPAPLPSRDTSGRPLPIPRCAMTTEEVEREAERIATSRRVCPLCRGTRMDAITNDGGSLSRCIDCGQFLEFPGLGQRNDFPGTQVGKIVYRRGANSSGVIAL